jgi:hypothetical protein
MCQHRVARFGAQSISYCAYSMSEVIIQQVRLDANRRLRLRPTLSQSSDYKFIWRNASSVRWDELTGELYVLDVPEFTPVDEFKQIIRAVAREYRQQLIVSSTTVYIDVPPDMAASFR